MFASVVLVCVLCQLLYGPLEGVTLSPCGDDDTAEVIQDKTDNTFTCTGLGSGLQVEWVVSKVSQPSVSVGYCPADGGGCQAIGLGAAFVPSRESSTESRMVIDPSQLLDLQYVKSWSLKCRDSANNEDSCQMDYVVPAEGSCTIQTGAGSSRFKLDGQCTLQPGAKSARNRFQCQWIRQGGTPWQHTVPLTPDNYQTECQLIGEPLPNITGQYNYTVHLLPGRETVSAGTVNISMPSAPTVSVSDGDFIGETTAVTCATDAIGQPPGRLQLVKSGVVHAAGEFGDEILTVLRAVNSSDGHPTELQCNVEWLTLVSGTAVRVSPSNPPSDATIKLDGAEDDLSVDENHFLEMRCHSTTGTPQPAVTLLKNNITALVTGSSELIYRMFARCEDNGRYRCVSDNGVEPAFIGTARSLLVACSPRPAAGDRALETVTFTGEAVSASFDVTAFPAPGEMTFLYMGPQTNTSQTSAVDDALIQLMGLCQAKSGVVYQSTCTVRVASMTSERSAGFYQVRVANEHGQGVFRLQVMYGVREAATGDPPEAEPGQPLYLWLAIGGFCVSAVVLIISIAIVVWICRHQRTLPRREMTESTITRMEQVSSSGHSSSHAESSELYEAVEMEDTRQSSLYTEFNVQDTTVQQK